MPIDSKTFARNPFQHLYKCSVCGYGAILPRPAESEVSSFYDLDRYYTQGASHMPDIEPGLLDRVLTKLAWWTDRGTSLADTLAALGVDRAGLVCEIGCGHASSLVELKALGYQTIGIDPDPKAVAIARSRGITVLEGTAENIPSDVAPHSVEVVLMSHSLEHCIQPALVVANVHRLLKPGGRFVCEVPNAGCTHFAWMGVCSEMFDVPRHLSFFTRSSLAALLERSGFEISSVDYEGFVRHFLPSWRATEENIRSEVEKVDQLPRRKHTLLTSALLWLFTFAAAPDKKYDSLRVTARSVIASNT